MKRWIYDAGTGRRSAPRAARAILLTAGIATCAGLAAVAGLAAPLAAQSAVGAKAGVTFASLRGPDEVEGLTGFTAGGYFGLGLADRLAVQIEANYMTRGGRGVHIGANTLDPDAPEADVELRYVEVPILLRTGFPGERFMPSFFVGPYVMFLLSCDLTPADGAAGECNDSDRAQWFSPRSTDYGLTAGLGLDYAVGESTVFLDGRYALGLASIQSGGEEFDATNRGLTITAGFAVPLGR